MIDSIIENNVVNIMGKVISDFSFSHEVYGEGFYTFQVEVTRLSEAVDILPITISERLMDQEKLSIGTLVEIEGQFRSYNSYTDKRNKLLLTIFTRDIRIITDEELNKNPNQIYLNGYVCKTPIYRTTPFGREIVDLLMAVNRPYNKSDYIPCIAWGRNARYGGKLEIGDHIKVWGRIQSRDYQKKLEDGRILSKVAFEVSVSKMEVLEEENNKKEDELEQIEE